MTTTTILKLQTANVKRIHVVEITPEGNVVMIGGVNGAGKSSVLDSIEYVLGGGKALPGQPLRKGAKKGKTILTLSGGMTATRTYTEKGSSLVVTGPDGSTVKSPQALLDQLVGELSFDPLAYARMKPADQADTLRRLVGLDTTALDAERQRVYDERTDAGREVKRFAAQLEGMPRHPDAPAEHVSIQALGDQLSRAQNEVVHIQAERDRARAIADEAKRSRERQRLMVSAIEAQERGIEELRDRIRKAEAELARSRAESAEADALATEEEAAGAEAVAAAAALVPPDTAPILAQMRDAEQINAHVRANAERAKVAESMAAAERRRVALDQKIDDIDERKQAMLAGAKFPVEGLGFDASGVTLPDPETGSPIPFAQASQGERLRVSVAMGLALNPKLRVMLVRDGSLLDSASLRMVAEMAAAHDAQVWIEKTSDTGEGCQVVIEDGYVRGARAAEPAQSGTAAGAEGAEG